MMEEKKQDWKRLLPYIGIPVLGLGLWFQEQDMTLKLLQETLMLFGYLAAVKDLREKRVPNALTGAMLAAWVLIMAPQLFYRTEFALWLMLGDVIGAVLAGIVFLIVYLVSRKGLGGGDVKLMTAAGLYLGADVLPAMLYGSVLAAAAGGCLLLTKKIGRRDTSPLVPFLYAGMLLAMFSQT